MYSKIPPLNSGRGSLWYSLWKMVDMVVRGDREGVRKGKGFGNFLEVLGIKRFLDTILLQGDRVVRPRHNFFFRFWFFRLENWEVWLVAGRAQQALPR